MKKPVAVAEEGIEAIERRPARTVGGAEFGGDSFMEEVPKAGKVMDGGRTLEASKGIA